MKNLKLIFAISLSLLCSSVFSQDKALITAFSQSYQYEKDKNYDAAIASIKPAYTEISYEANLRLGWLNYMAARYKESTMYYLKAISLKPMATEPLWAVINPLSVLERWAEVEFHYNNILKLDPRNTVANYQLGIMYYFRKDYIKAKRYFDVSLNLYPFDYNSMLMSAWTNYFLGNKSDARTIFMKVLLYNPTDASALEGLALTK